MKKNILLFIIALLFITPAITFAQKKSITADDKSFMLGFLPKIIDVNKGILSDRNNIIKLKKQFTNTGKLSNEEEISLSEISAKYGINSFKLDDKGNKDVLQNEFNDLLIRVDIIPTKLVMAQAICESAWGKSYFAKNGKNYFGVHCYHKGCGLVPSGDKNAGFEVKSYPTVLAGIIDYIHILNTYSAYEGLRNIRSRLRKDNQQLNPLKLAEGLSRYSQKGEEYVKILQSLINNYIPANIQVFLKKNSIN
jgi:Bax protein